MSLGVAGRTFTFTVLFLDGFGAPSTPTDAEIEVFYFSDGDKVTLFSGAMTATPEPGRFKHGIIIPATLTEADTVYGIMRGTDPTTSSLMVIEQEVSIVTVMKAGAI